MLNLVGRKKRLTFAAKLEILILFILNGHCVVKRDVYFFMQKRLIAFGWHFIGFPHFFVGFRIFFPNILVFPTKNLILQC